MITIAWVLYFTLWTLSIAFHKQLEEITLKKPLVLITIGLIGFVDIVYLMILDTRCFLTVILATLFSCIGISRALVQRFDSIIEK
jgi:hypothetical protein